MAGRVTTTNPRKNPMADKDWKRFERKVAEQLGGRRVPITGRQRGDAPDVEHDALSIECKKRNVIPKWFKEAMNQAEASVKNREQVPIVVIHEKGQKNEDDYVVLRMKHFKALSWWED